MFLLRLEYRDKPTATNWRRMQFDKQMNFISENAALPAELLRIIASLTAFGANAQNHHFANGIARMTFQAAHQQFMWFCKSTQSDNNLLIDEEELYDDGNTLLMRRAFEEFTLADTEAGSITIDQSMLAQHPELDVLQKLQHGFSRVRVLQPNNNTIDATLDEIRVAPHGTMILVDGSALLTPLDLSTVTQRSDIQLLTVNCTGIPDYKLEQKGKNIALLQQ